MDVPLSRAVRGDDRSAISSITLDVKVLSCSYGAEDPTSRATLGENPLPNNSSHPSVMTDVSSTMAMGLAADLLVASSMETKADDGIPCPLMLSTGCLADDSTSGFLGRNEWRRDGLGESETVRGHKG